MVYECSLLVVENPSYLRPFVILTAAGHVALSPLLLDPASTLAFANCSCTSQNNDSTSMASSSLSL